MLSANASRYRGGVFQTVVSRLKSPGSCRNGYLSAASRERLETMHLVLVSGPVPKAGRDDRRAFVIEASLAFPHGTSLEQRQFVEQPRHDLGQAVCASSPAG